MHTSQYIEFIMKNSINQYAVKNSKVTHIKNTVARPGKVAATFSKEDLSNYGVNGVIYGSIEKLVESSRYITHWTPNPYRYLKYDDNKRVTKHTKDNIKQINTFVIDIDTDYSQEHLTQSLISAHIDNGVPFPNMYVKSPNGWHLYYVLDNPLYMNREKRSLFVAEKVQRSILSALNNYIDIDIHCVPFGFYRFPTVDTVKHFTNEYISKDELINWSMSYSEKNKPALEVVYSRNKSERPEWVSTLLNLKNIKPKNGYRACRNNTIFTLALYFYSADESYEKTFNILDEFNSALNIPLNVSEFKGIIQSAFSGKYKAPNKDHIQNIIETWTNEEHEISANYFKTFYKHKKKRTDRVRSHYEERIQDVVNYLEEHTDTESLYIEGTISNILAEFNMPKSTFYDVLNTLQNDNIIYKKTEGKGRYSKTRIALSKNILMKFYILIQKNKVKQANYVAYVESIVPAIFEVKDNSELDVMALKLITKLIKKLDNIQQIQDKTIAYNSLII
ncbi:primase C-terminal domain-containing protein [Salinicoccus jeotgali]|uniref:Primase C-terminal domain-containing protein n=1 Tax=Salinicoccus jeotgali TaxID=381634 RepID=A0ABP7E501_9STAP